MIKLIAKIKEPRVFWPLLVLAGSHVIGLNLAVGLFLACLSGYLKSRNLTVKNYKILHLILFFLIVFSISLFVIKNRMPVYFLPFSIIPMLTVLLFGSLEISLILTLAISVSVASIFSYPLQILLLFLVSGIFSSIFIWGARKRVTIIHAGVITGIIQAIIMMTTNFYWSGLVLNSFGFIFNGLASSIIVLGVLPIFEYLFSRVTNISLLELADFHHPLLQRLVQEAPGTYHHSLIVGNLSETACRAVCANSLLARIGAYYHDIGKLHQPEYFSENQSMVISKHDTLAPTMSKLVIMNHVKEGVELAKKYKLSQPLIDFIQQHHGNSLVFYFYRRALESLEEDQDVKEEGFRYPGPKPASKETAIVLLADSVEAAARALKEPTPSKIEELVHKVINNKFIDGQLDECELTLKDLEKISAVFIRLLCGIYHSRASYPEGIRSENNHKKSAKEDSRLSEKDKKVNP
ncbi:MAG: HDIG domain-containing protein [Candidatus Omnitrophica bacterium]|nr:HDIG domain-containing protein [Candidatus Omnitrophota bacterium]